MKNWKSNSNRALTIIAICLLLGAIIYQKVGYRENTFVLLQGVFPAAGSYETSSGKYPAYRVFDSHQVPVGYVVMAESTGYGGPMTVLVGINPEGEIIKTEIVKNHETPLYLEMVISRGFLDGFIGKTISDPLMLNEDIDGVSGATVSAKGIASAVRKGVRQIGVQEFGLEENNGEGIQWGAEEFILLALFLIILISIKLKLAKLRFVILAFSVFFLGFRLGASINLGNIASLISGNLPSFAEWPFWFFLVVGTLLLILVSGRNLYCSWLCPFGAVQEGIHRALCLMRYGIPQTYLVHAGKLRLTLTWIALMIAFICLNPSIAGYEPFSAFFGGQANTGQWLIMGLVLFMSIFANRIWCRFFCPTGAVMDLVASIKGVLAGNLGKKVSREIPAENKINTVDENQVKGDDDITREENPQKLFLWVLMGFIVLIVFTLFKNAGIL